MSTKAAYLVSKNTSESLAIYNLLDREYYESTLALGRTYYGEVAWRF
jgi:outer membrane receptor protein involved in Fe transport